MSTLLSSNLLALQTDCKQSFPSNFFCLLYLCLMLDPDICQPNKNQAEVRAYVRKLCVIDNQRALTQLSYRLEPRRTWAPDPPPRRLLCDVSIKKKRYKINQHNSSKSQHSVTLVLLWTIKDCAVKSLFSLDKQKLFSCSLVAVSQSTGWGFISY